MLCEHFAAMHQEYRETGAAYSVNIFSQDKRRLGNKYNGGLACVLYVFVVVHQPMENSQRHSYLYAVAIDPACFVLFFIGIK